MKEYYYVPTITLDDEKEYMVLDHFKIENDYYYILSEEENEEEIRIQKAILKNEEEFLTDVKNKNELALVYQKFLARHPEGKESFL